MGLVQSPGIEVFAATAVLGITIGTGAIATLFPRSFGARRRAWIAAGLLSLAVCTHRVVVQEYGWQKYGEGLARVRDELIHTPGAVHLAVLVFGFAIPALLLLLAALVDRLPGDEALWHERVLARILARLSPGERRSPWLSTFMAGSRSVTSHDETNPG